MSKGAEQVARVTSETMTYVGSAATVVSGLTINEWGVIIGAIVAIVGLVSSTLINIWFKRRQLRILEAQISTQNSPQE